MRMKSLNCPNCGAPITGHVCEYCGSVFEFHGARENALADARRELVRAQCDAANLAQAEYILQSLNRFVGFSEVSRV